MVGILALRASNIAIRALAMASRFVLIIALAKFLTPADVGLFGLFLATVSFSMLVVGGDYYTYSQRELLSLPRERWSFVLQQQALATGALYVCFFPLQLLLFSFDLLPEHLLLWFFVLLLVEHLAQEINRLLVAMQRPLTANWVFFVRTGLWVWLVLPVMWFVPDLRRLELVYLAWLLGALSAIVFGAATIRREVAPWQRWTIDRAWIMRGFKVGFMFLVATMCFKALQTVDRYVVEYLAGADLLGVYVVYISLAMSVAGFLDPAVYSFLYPRLVSAVRQGQTDRYRAILHEMTLSSVGLSVGLALAAAVVAPFIFEYIGQPLYVEHLPVFWLLLVAAVVYGAGLVPHYCLYAHGADRTIVIAHVSALIVFIGATIVAAAYAAFAAAAMGLLVAFTWMGVFKLWRYLALAHASARELKPGLVENG
jgi:O-antigen/teichoic acid export membrane protein